LRPRTPHPRRCRIASARRDFALTLAHLLDQSKRRKGRPLQERKGKVRKGKERDPKRSPLAHPTARNGLSESADMEAGGESPLATWGACERLRDAWRAHQAAPDRASVGTPQAVRSAPCAKSLEGKNRTRFKGSEGIGSGSLPCRWNHHCPTVPPSCRLLGHCVNWHALQRLAPVLWFGTLPGIASLGDRMGDGLNASAREPWHPPSCQPLRQFFTIHQPITPS